MSKQDSNLTGQERTVVSSFFKSFFVLTWLSVFVSAMSVVYSTYESRQYTQQLEELRRQEITLRVTTGQYELEKSSLASYPRIESIATGKLSMGAPLASETVLVVRE